MENRIFISYSSKDNKVAQYICSAVEQNNIKVWIAPRDIKPGYAYGSEIIRGIESCSHLLVVLSRNSITSQAVRNETERASSKNKTIIPFFLEEVTLDKEWEFLISRSQWLLGYNKDIDLSINKLINSIIGGKPETDNQNIGLKKLPCSSTQNYSQTITPKIKVFLLIACISLIGIVFILKFWNYQLEQRKWSTACRKNTLDAYRLFMNHYPNSKFTKLAKENRCWLSVEDAQYNLKAIDIY